MQINDLLRKDLMILDLQATEKEAAIDEMIERLSEKMLFLIKKRIKKVSCSVKHKPQLD